MVLVRGGTFRMGDDESEFSEEKPAHPVQLQDFYISEFPVTQALWKAVMGPQNNPSYYKGNDRPVETVSWLDTQQFMDRLNGMIKGSVHHFRLPTEAEWEYAARGGPHQASGIFAGGEHLKEVGWYRKTSHKETKDVGQLQPNELSIYEMSGNVWEWCQDWYAPGYYRKCLNKGVVEQPAGPVRGSERVLRGGSWDYGPVFCRVSYRNALHPEGRDGHVGFRLARSPVSGSGASFEQKEAVGAT